MAAAAMTSSGQILIGGSSGPAVATLTAGANITITNADGAITLAVTEGVVKQARDFAMIRLFGH